MARTVNAEVVLAALAQIEDVLAERTQMQSTRISIARRRVAALRQQVENVAEES
jgi:hypothetical protein